MSKALKSRLDRLEQRITRRAPPRIVFRIHDRDDGEVTGYRAGNVAVVRSEGETAQTCANRAFELQPSAGFIAAIYAKRPWSADEREEAPQRCAVTADAPTASDGQQIDPYDVGQPGIGRIASREELERMGAIAVPPERPL